LHDERLKLAPRRVGRTARSLKVLPDREVAIVSTFLSRKATFGSFKRCMSGVDASATATVTKSVLCGTSRWSSPFAALMRARTSFKPASPSAERTAAFFGDTSENRPSPLRKEDCGRKGARNTTRGRTDTKSILLIGYRVFLL
jgi:hypothetical protein